MAAEIRSPCLREDERMLVSGWIQMSGPDINGTLVWKLLNDRRAETARKAAVNAGKSAEEVEAAVRASGLTVQSVRRDIRVLLGRAQQAGLAGAAVFLDDQAQAVRDEIEQTHLMDEQIVRDLERSRSETWSRTRGVRKVVSVNGQEQASFPPTEVVRFRQEEGAAQAALYGRLQENMRRRAALRGELRLLQFGRQNVPEPADDAPESVQTLAEIVMDLDDPQQAREGALRLLRRRIQELDRAVDVPLAGDMLKLERLRLQNLEMRLRPLHDWLKRPADEPGEFRSYEITYEEVEPRRLPAATDEGAEEDAEIPAAETP